MYAMVEWMYLICLYFLIFSDIWALGCVLYEMATLRHAVSCLPFPPSLPPSFLLSLLPFLSPSLPPSLPLSLPPSLSS